jgi:transcriptional regulator with XRE-family HTH domain
MTDLTGVNIRLQRESRGWTQEHLADVSGIDVRTVQRAERGERLSADTLRGLAAAFDITVAELRKMPKQVAEATDRFKLIRLRRIERALELRDCFPADACNFGYDTVVDDRQEDAIAEFERDLADVNDVWSGLDAVQKLDLVRALQRHVDALAGFGLTVAVAVDPLRLRGEQIAKPFTMNMLHVVISPAAEPKLFAMWDRTAPIQFQ